MGGAEFEDPNSYQSKALRFLEEVLSPTTEIEYIRYYGLACIYYASFGVPNKYTRMDIEDDDLRGWITSGNWITDTDYCNWYGLVCDDNTGLVTEILLFTNRMYGIFAPEVQFLADSLIKIDLFNNFYLFTDNDAGNAWIAEMVNLEELFFGTTSFEYPGIPTFINQIPTLSKYFSTGIGVLSCRDCSTSSLLT